MIHKHGNEFKYESQIKVYGNPDKLYELFYPELNDDRNRHGRSSFLMKKGKDHIIFEISAKDAVALRATFNSLSKLLAVEERSALIK